MTIDEALNEIQVYLNSDCYLDAPSNEAMELAMQALLAMEKFIEGVKQNKMDMGYSAQLDYRLFHNGSLRQVGGYDFCPECMKDFKNWAHGWEEKQTGWISVKDRLPEPGTGFVLVCANRKFRNITMVNALMLAEYSGEEGWILELFPDFSDVKITHWMPLPEPPGDSDAQD